MKTLLVLLSAALLGTTVGCRDRDHEIVRDDDIEVRKPVETAPAAEPDDDFIQTRSTFQLNARERLDRLNARIEDLGNRADTESQQAADRLRAKRDELSTRLSGAGDQVESGWDRFESDMRSSFDQLEAELDAAVD